MRVSLFLLTSMATFSSSTAQDFQQPSWRDEVHAVWLNGPSHSAQIGGPLPTFGTGNRRGNSKCNIDDPTVKYTGYASTGAFCMPSSPDLNDNPHLVMYSGNVGLVLDASASSDNLIPKFGLLGSEPFPNGVVPNEAYDSLDPSSVTAQLTMTCPNVETAVLNALPIGSVAEFGLVRQGHAVAHVTMDKLEWSTGTGNMYSMDPICDLYPNLVNTNEICSSDFGEVTGTPCSTTDYPTCRLDKGGKCYAPADGPGPAQNDPWNCNQDYGGSSWPCSAAYPECVGFIQGSAWGRCYTATTNEEDCDSDFGAVLGACPTEDFPICNENNYCTRDPSTCYLEAPWFDVTMWGDSIALHLRWNPTAAPGCTGTVQFDLGLASGTVSDTADFTSEDKAAVLLTSCGNAWCAVPSDDIAVTSSGTVLQRPDFGDFIVEVPNWVPTCSYTHCGNVLATVDVTVSNSHPSESRPVRLSLSRKFETGYAITQNGGIGAEITGMSIMVWDKATQQPNGIPIHISKNWHAGVGNSIYAGTWWTANLFFHLPAGASKDLTFAIVYEQYKGVTAYSHAQLSIIGYSNRWLWEEGGLGAGGENFVMDPLGSHTRAVITDVRPKLHDGSWKENVGGGDFLYYFDGNGAMQYKKQLDARLFVNGPNLSNSSYTSISGDGAIESKVQVSGGRTDDIVRVFIHIRNTVLQPMSFTRLSYFQMGGESYNYHPTFQDFVFGHGDGTVTLNIPRTCSSGTDRADWALYESVNDGYNMYRETLTGARPWWFAFGPNTDAKQYSEDPMVVGDRGLIIRSFEASYNGVIETTPSASILCDKIELGPPAGLSSLMAGDYVDIKLEMLVLPRPEDFQIAVDNSPNSLSLQYLNSFGTTWERVREHALGDILVSSVSSGGSIESHYPVRVCVPPNMDLSSNFFKFTLTGKAVGYVPIVVCGLDSPGIPAGNGLRKMDGASFNLLSDEEGDALQANYDRVSGKYEIVFNVLVDAATEFAFGPDPAGAEEVGASIESSWYADYESLEANLNSDDIEVTLKYNAAAPDGTNKYYQVYLMNQDCTQVITSDVIQPSDNPTTGIVDGTKYDADAGILPVVFSIDKTTIESSSDFYTAGASDQEDGTIVFCSMVALKNEDGLEVIQRKVISSLSVNLQVGFGIFQITGFAGALAATEYNQNIELSAALETCFCDEANVCVDPVDTSPGQSVQFCIKTADGVTDLFLEGLANVRFENSMDEAVGVPIIGSDGNPAHTLSSIDCTTTAGICNVKTVAYSRIYWSFIDDQLIDISSGANIVGSAVLGLTRRRRGLEEQRDLQDSAEKKEAAPFELELTLASPPGGGESSSPAAVSLTHVLSICLFGLMAAFAV